MVLVVSDYVGAGLTRLLGAANDERRISAMLGANGFSVANSVAPTRVALLSALASFARQAGKHDVAVVYSTGHGVEWNGRVYLLPGDYRFGDGCSAALLRARAISVDQLAAACRGLRLNVVFFAGCRTLGAP